VYANELNPEAYKYLQENIKLNRTYNVHPVPGDARELSKTFKAIADRVVMPIPMSAPQFLDVAFALAKKNAIVHFYHFVESEKAAVDIIKKFAKKHNKKIKIVHERIVRRYSPSIIEVVVDFKIL
jgi:tRNA (guanine37-N1)-methyltransferase